MNGNKYFLAIFVMTALVIGGVAAVRAPQGKFRNLKVLPQDITDQKLDSIMHSYNVALGVDCKFCHAPIKNIPPIMRGGDSLDFASDAEPMKNNARDMIRMMIDINKNYFWYDKAQRPEYLHTVACMTCHRGEELPPEVK